MPSLDHDRKSRVAFLSGGRGTGKSTVLLSLLWSFQEGSPRAEYPFEIQGMIPRLAGRLVWLDPLDMDPLPKASKLFAAILVRLDRALARGRLPTSPGLTPPPVWPDEFEEPTDPYQKSLMYFHRLQVDVATAWESNLAERAGHLDPSAYGMEVLSLEHLRLSFNQRLNEALQALAQDVLARGSVRNPLFVLPIEDFDLNLLRCLELLDLLRSISVPRLFFLILGDADAAEMIINVRVAGDLTAVSQGAAQAGFLPVLPQEVAAHAAQVAGDRMRKLIPPAQRVNLEPLELNEAFRFRPKDRQVADLPTMEKLLETCPGPRWRQSWAYLRIREFPSLKDFLLQPSLVAVPRPGRDRAEVEGSSVRRPLEEALSLAAYRARDFLRLPPRLLSDLWFSFQDVVAPVAPPTSSPIAAASNAPVPKEADRRNPLLEMLRRQCKEALGREPRLLPPQRHQLIGLLSMDPEGEWIFPGGTFQLFMPFDSQRAFAVPPWERMAPATRTIQARETGGWGLSAQSLARGGEPSSTAQYLTTPTTPLLILYTDLATFDSPTAVRNPLLDLRPEIFRIASLEWETFGGRALHVWPLPPIATFWEFDLFLSGWRDATWAVHEKSFGDVIVALVFIWIDLGAALLGREAPCGWPSEFDLQALRWQDLRGRLEGVLTSVAPHGNSIPMAVRVREWIAHLSVLLAPETLGDRPDVRQVFQSSPTLSAFWGTAEGSRFLNEFRSGLRAAGLVQLVEWAERV